VHLEARESNVMKKRQVKKLSLGRETISNLDALSRVRGNADNGVKTDICKKPSWMVDTCGLCPYPGTMYTCPVWV
jgi:hypothetical protein